MNREFFCRRILERSIRQFVLCSLLFTGCLHTPYAIEKPIVDMEGFVSVYERYQEDCPYFVHKGINWIEIMEDYYTEATLCENEDELAEVVGDMLAELHDPVIRLEKRVWIGMELVLVDSILPYVQEYDVNYSMDVLEEEYLEQYGWAGWEEGYVGGFGWCDPALLPYMFMNRIPSSGADMDSLDAFIAECIELDLPAVIVDIRMNPTGRVDGMTGICGKEFNGRFAAKTYKGAISRTRSGSGYDQYYDIHSTFFPSGPAQFTGTVILLVGENCCRAAENMAASFMNFPNVVLVGETTRGSVSSYNNCLFTDSWKARVIYRTLLTNDKVWIEGNGIPADHIVEATEADFAAGIDPVLDYAIEMLEASTGFANGME